MRRRYAAFQAAGADIVVVGMGTPVQTRQFSQKEKLPFPILADPRRRAYRAYGAVRGTLRQVTFTPRVWLRGVQAATRGHLVSAVVGDGLQLSATFIVDRTGHIRFAQRSGLSSEYASADTLLNALTGATPEAPPLARRGAPCPGC